MPGLVPGIHVLQRCSNKDVDGRNKSGHDEGKPGTKPVDNPCITLGTTRWIRCGKPVDDPVEKPVHKRCKSAQRFSEKAGYVPVNKAVHDRCV
jgi:hypothetical protein